MSHPRVPHHLQPKSSSTLFQRRRQSFISAPLWPVRCRCVCPSFPVSVLPLRHGRVETLTESGRLELPQRPLPRVSRSSDTSMLGCRMPHRAMERPSRPNGSGFLIVSTHIVHLSRITIKDQVQRVAVRFSAAPSVLFPFLW